MFKKGESEELDSQEKFLVGKVRVEGKLRVGPWDAVICEVEEGIVKIGYKLKKGRKKVPIMKIQKERKDIEFAIPGDKVALILDGSIEVESGEVLKIYST
ncbi:hypothetical protein A3L04_05630 [Thermococcus chitonophagus]|uniref:Elongation factor Tu-type domain-containing protein n=1 Tax=Thermococcus chitonophagus TaxID=54262 RepID=A0A2Z2N7H1_9EURY|nr:hypothetical protein A3L04_05630 [Thermococcus chitonophagus]